MSSVRRMEVAVNDLANIQTPGYRAERTAAASFSEQLVAQLGLQNGSVPVGPLLLVNAAEAPQLDLTQGPIVGTGRALDIALDGPGFLVVERPDGIAYTRDGGLSVDEQGYLTGARGTRVLGTSGPIQVPSGDVVIGPDGTVHADGVPLDRLRIVEFAPDQRFQKLGTNLLIPAGGSQPPADAGATMVYQGFMEGSNVDVTTTMTTMLELQRAYSANTRMIQFQDQILVRAVNDIARPMA
jgi:flagellar basal body rod protein FlgG